MAGGGECRVLDSTRVYQAMSSPVITVPPTASLREAARIMYESNVGSAIVVDDDGRPLGVVTRRDILYLYASGEACRDPPVRVYMKEPVLTCSPEDTLGEVLRRMRAAGVRHMVVVDDGGRAVGVVSMYDILVLLAGECLGEY